MAPVILEDTFFSIAFSICLLVAVSTQKAITGAIQIWNTSSLTITSVGEMKQSFMAFFTTIANPDNGISASYVSILLPFGAMMTLRAGGAYLVTYASQVIRNEIYILPTRCIIPDMLHDTQNSHHLSTIYV